PLPSFEDWYRAEHPRLVGVLMGVGADLDTAADVAAEAFSRALERWDRVGAMASPSGWTAQVGFNLLRRRARRHGLEQRLLLRHRIHRRRRTRMAVRSFAVLAIVATPTAAIVAARSSQGPSRQFQAVGQPLPPAPTTSTPTPTTEPSLPTGPRVTLAYARTGL